jgi:DNA polymerase III alpha subunit
MNSIIPLFSSHYSIGRSVLTLDSPDGGEDCPQSIFSIAKKTDLNEIYLCESGTISSFIEFYNGCKEYGFSGRFGIKLCVCDNFNVKDEESLKNESKIVIWANNTDGYYDLVKIFSKAATDGFYYQPRTDWNVIKSLWTNNLSITFPYYSSFLAKNLLTFANIVPNFDFCLPTFFIEPLHNLPQDRLLNDCVSSFCQNKYPVCDTHSIYYGSKGHFKAYYTFCCISNRSNLMNPKLDGLCSDSFGPEEYINYSK